MKLIIKNTPQELGVAAGTAAGNLILDTITEKGSAHIIVATGTSQFETLRQLTSRKDIDWSKVVMFHLDEYIGLPITAPASFRKYLKERFLDKIQDLQAYHLINGENDPADECGRLNKIIKQYSIDVALVGVGENGHLAFNDPPADFDTEEPYIVVELDELCRKQQMGEGWFSSLAEVPTKAISMSVRQILKSRYIICSVPDERKALAVKNCLEQGIDNRYPASILQEHPQCTYYLDTASAQLLSRQTIEKFS